MSSLAPTLATAHLKGPHVDFAGLSPLIALLGGAVLVLLVGLLGSRWVRAQVVPALSLGVARRRARPDDLAVERSTSRSSRARCAIDDLSLALNLILIAGGACAVLLAWRSRAAQRSRRTASSTRCC